MTEGEYVRSLFVTLRRGLVGKSWFHRRVLAALGLRHPHQCLEKPNNESIRGMVQKVAHLVIVETDKMFYLRNLREYYKQLPREELVVHHGAAVAAHLQQQQQLAKLCADADCNASTSTSSSTSQSQAPQPAQPAATWMGSTWTSAGSSYSPETAMSQDFRTWLPPMQSIHIQSHLQEHVSPLPPDNPSGHKAEPSVRAQVKELLTQRGQALRRGGLYSPQVAELNARIMALREEEVRQEADERLRLLEQRHTPELKGKKPELKTPWGKGSTRGLLREQLANAGKMSAEKADAARARWQRRKEAALQRLTGPQQQQIRA